MKQAVENFCGVSLSIRLDVFHHDVMPWKPIDRVIAEEVIVRDCYRLRHLLNAGFTPRTSLDLGSNIGAFTAFATFLWPACKSVCVEMAADFCDCIRLNCPNATVHQAIVGEVPAYQDFERFPHLLAGSDNQVSSVKAFLVTSVDLLKLDIEGSERAVFDELREANLMTQIGVIVGEWHGEKARRSVIDACYQSHYLIMEGGGDHNVFTALPMKRS